MENQSFSDGQDKSDADFGSYNEFTYGTSGINFGGSPSVEGGG